MNRKRRELFFAGAFIIVGCLSGSCARPSPTAPSAVPTHPIVVSGQSNALLLAPFLSAVYPLPVLTVAENGQSIAAWDVGHPARHWENLAQLLHQPIQAFVWWQGESDRQTPDYEGRLVDLIARVRAENAPYQARLFVVLVRILPKPENESVRAVQVTVAARDGNAVLISTDDVPANGSTDHLTDAGYQLVTTRVLGAIP